jgi:hypothetical protein
MKTNYFDFRRVGLLFQRYFVERFRSELIYWGIMAIVFMFLRNSPSSMFALILIAGIFYAARFFKEIHHSGNGVAYFMIPATQLEKLTVAVVMTTVYFYVMMMITYIIGNLTGTFLSNMLASLDFFSISLFHHSSLQWVLFEKAGLFPIAMFEVINSDVGNIRNAGWFLSVFLLIQSVFLLGSIYFKRSQVFKTFLTVFLLFLFLFVLSLIEGKLILGDHIQTMTGAELKAASDKEWDMWLEIFAVPAKICYFLLPVYLWVVSYFRLTEKQV